MGGGKQNRTKNNVRPSNSERSAAMLHSTLPNFAGFSGSSKPIGFSSFALNPMDDLESIDDNFQLVLKKVNKKDCTTKLKGLQELADLLQQADLSVIKTLLPFWPRFYSILVIHPDNRVREATQCVHVIIVQKAKREIAPYLKQLMAPWYTSQYDNYPPAATAAMKAFAEAFSPPKFKEAVIYCHQEILNYIHDNLLNQSAESVASNQMSPEEAEARYERIIISCLQGYTMYLKEVPENKIQESVNLNMTIVADKKFWKLASNKITLIRSAWYQTLSIMLQNALYLLKGKESQSMNIILNNLDEGEITVLPHVWECLLLATSNAEWWENINIESHFIPKITAVLKQAGNGNATLIYPNFLPLLSNVPLEGIKQKLFYMKFFESMCLGLKNKSVASNTQDTKAISSAYVECLQFLITRNISNSELCSNAVNILCNLIEWSLSEDCMAYLPIFKEITNITHYLRKNIHVDSIQKLMEYFFVKLYGVFYRFINFSSEKNPAVCLDDMPLLASKQVDLILSLKQVGVEFGQAEDVKSQVYLEIVQKFGVSIFKIYIHFTKDNSTNVLFEPICRLVSNLDRRLMFESLLQEYENANNIKGSYMDIYLNWLKKCLLTDQTYGKNVLEFIFLLLENLDDTDQDVILNDLLEIDHPDLLIWSVLITLRKSSEKSLAIKKWLRNRKITELILSIAEMFGQNDCNPELEFILLSALRANKDEDLVDPEVSEKIINNVSTNLSDKKDTLDSTCKLAIHICKIMQDSSLKLGDRLLVTIFELSCKFDEDNPSVSPHIYKELKNVWDKALCNWLCSVYVLDREKIIQELLNCLENNLKIILVDGRRARIDPICSLAMDVVDVIWQSDEKMLNWVVDHLVERSAYIEKRIVDICKVAEYIHGTLDCPFEELAADSPVEEEFISFFVNKFLTTYIFKALFSKNKIFNENSVHDINKLASLLHSSTVTLSFVSNFKNVKHYMEMLYYGHLIESTIIKLLNEMDKDHLDEVKDKIRANALSEGWFWYKTLYLFFKKISKNENVADFHEDLCKHIRQTNDEVGAIHVTQAYRKVFGWTVFYTTDEIRALFDEIRANGMVQFEFGANNMTWNQSNRVIRAMKKCSEIMEHISLTLEEWDFVVLALVSWTTNCLKTKKFIKNYQYQAMLVSISDLYLNTCTKVQRIKSEIPDLSYVSEWEDVLFEGIHCCMAEMWLFLADQYQNHSENHLLCLPLLQRFGKNTSYFRSDLIFNRTDGPKWTRFLKISWDLLTNSQAILQIWGYRMLLVLIPGLTRLDDQAVSTTTPHKNGLIFEQFKRKLDEVQDIVTSVLQDFRVGENSCRIEPSYDSFTYTFAYLLLWDAMLSLCEKASPELRFQYSDWLKNGPILHEFLSNLFKLMPSDVITHDDTKPKPIIESKYSENPIKAVSLTEFCGSATIENMACYLYRKSVEEFPALVRQWWTVLDIKASQYVDKITGLYVSQHICNKELNNVVQHQNSCKNLKVKVMPTVREIQAVYTVDEAQMELTITLPQNYPLGIPIIVCDKQIGGSSQKQWLLQFQKCVLHQNGKIWDGLFLWNQNLDKKFDGVEECYICYAVLHSGTYQMPKLCCRTCKKKFHSACLYKWFSTSNKSSCPICRNLF